VSRTKGEKMATEFDHECYQWRTVPALPILKVIKEDPINPEGVLTAAELLVWEKYRRYVNGGYRWVETITVGGAPVIVLGRRHYVTFDCPPSF
jgi:hypothetical protein